MAKLSVAVAVALTVLLFLLTVSQARIPSNLPENDDVNGRELPFSHSDSDVSPVLRLPSDSVNDEPHSTETAGDIPESESISIRSIPLRVFRFRPINRHFPIGPRSPFHHNCRRHLHRRHDLPFFKPLRQQQEEEHVEIPYGNDMILSTGGNNEFDQLMFHHGRMRRIPAKWVNFRHRHHHHHHHEDDEDHDHDHDHDHEDDGLSKFLLEHSLRFGKEKFKKHLHHHHEDDHEEEENEEMNKKHLHHHHEDDHDEEENEEMKEREERREEKEGGLVNRIRKFLDHF